MGLAVSATVAGGERGWPLVEVLRLGSHFLHRDLEGLGGGAALLEGADAGLDAARELLTGRSLEALHPLFDTPIGADPVMDGLLGHPGRRGEVAC